MGRIVHFEVHASEPERLVAFYEAVFDWRADAWEGPMPYWTLTTGPEGEPGINGGLVIRQGARPAPDAPVGSFVCVVDVDDLDGTWKLALAKGASVALEPFVVPGVGRLGYIRDPDGNLLGMIQPEERGAQAA